MEFTSAVTVDSDGPKEANDESGYYVGDCAS